MIDISNNDQFEKRKDEDMRNKPTIIETISKLSDSEYAIDYLDLDAETSSKIYDITEQHNAVSLTGDLKGIFEDAINHIEGRSSLEDEKPGTFSDKLVCTLIDAVEESGLGVMTEDGIEEKGGSWHVIFETESGIYTVTLSKEGRA